MSYWVYVHTCKANGKKYVGITTKIKPELRWAEGNGYQTNKHFYSAIKKYGWSNFEHEAWELTCESEMYYAEKYLIAYYHTTESKFGYNHSSGGESGGLGCTRSEETKRKISKANRKSHSDPEIRRKKSEAHKERWSDPGFREKVSKAMKERWSDPEVRRKRTEIAKKVHSDPEVRRKISKALKGKEIKEETRRKISKTLTGRHHPRIKIKLPDGTIRELTKNVIVSHYVNKGKKFEYVD